MICPISLQTIMSIARQSTRIGTYNPDWAILLEDRDALGDATGQKLYFVRETKSTSDPEELQPDEWDKIRCGKAHFNEGLEDVEFDWGPPEGLLGQSQL